ncbi:Rib/alpha-like domain-containing protein [Suicoccus acidiformans]|nr:Rib/alpha-like domain-containing protein [Suicoccus acidiformans]
MVGRNNHKVRRQREGDEIKTYAIKRLSVGVASVAVAAGIIFASDVPLAQAAGTVDAVNGTLEITPEQQAEVTATHEAYQEATPTMATTTDPVTGQNIPADGGVAQMIETSKELRIKNPELAKELEAQSDNGPSDAVVSTEPAPTDPALTAPAKVENAERTEESTVYTGKPVDSNLLNTALDAKNPDSVKKENNITGYGVNLSDFSKAGNKGNTVFEIKNTAFHPTVPPVDRYEVRYEIDDRIARYVEDIRYIARDSDKTSDRDFSMTRLNDVTDPAKVSNTWKMNAYDTNVVTSNNDPNSPFNFDSMFASSQTGFNKNATLQVKLKDTWENILKEFPEAKENNELFFNAYLYDPVDNKVIDGSINKTFFKTKPTALDKLQSAGFAQEVPGHFGFTNGQAQYVEGGTVDPYTGQYDPNAKVRGIAVDQSFSKHTAGEVVSEPSTYHFQADERLVPYIKGVGIYRPKRDARAFDRDLHAYEQVFYNGLILNDDQSGILSTLPIAKPNERLKGNADQYYMDYDPKTGSGHFKVDPDTSGAVASGNRQMNKAGGDGAALAGVRVVYFIKDDVNIDQLRPASLDQNYAFTGYFLDQKGNYLANTEGNISYNFGDFKGDPSPITNKGNPGVDDTTRTNPKDQELPEVKTPTYIAQAEPKTVLLNTKVTAEDLIKAQAVDADGQPVDFPEGTVFQFVKVDAEGKFVEDLKDENGKDLKALDTSQVGLQEVNIRVTLPRQSTSRIISGLVQVNKRPGESGQKLSEEQFIPMTNSGSRNEFNSEGFLNNVMHQMETKLAPESQAENEIDVTVSSLIHLIPSESEDTLKKWDYVIEFSDNVAKHIVSIENSKGGEFERIVNRKGDLTNSWKMRAWGGAGDRESLMTNTAVGAGNNYPVKVTLDTSVTAVLNEVKADLGREVTNGDIDSTAYVYNNAEKAIVDGSYSSTFLKVQPTEYDAKETTDKPVWNNWFELSSGQVKYFEGNSISPYTGLTGDKVRGFAVDQFFGKSGGSSLNTFGATVDPLHYHYTVDKRLIPYLESASLYYIPNGEDNYNNSAVGKDFSYIPQAQVFFNGQDHEWDGFRNEFDPTTGQGTFKLDSDPGTIARLINFDNSHLDPGAARIVYTLRDGVTLNDILKDNPGATYVFTGYLTLDSGPKVRNSNANIGYTISDINGDGIADEWQNIQYKDLSDHEKEILTPIEAALVNKGLTGTNANVLVTEARANDNSVEGLLNVGYIEGEARTVVVETVAGKGEVVKLGEGAVDPVTGKFTINFTDPDAKLVEGQELLVSVVNEGKTVAANVQTVKAADQIVKSYNNVVDLVQPTPESQEVAVGNAIENVQLETFTELADADKPADVTIPAYDGESDTNILKFVSYTQKGVTGDPTTDVAEVAKQPTLPAGLSIVNGVLQGTPEITDWADGETERVLTFVEDATNDKEGNATDRTFTITVKRQLIADQHDMKYDPIDVVPGDKAETAPKFTEAGTETKSTPKLKTDSPFTADSIVKVDGKDIAVTVDPATGVVTVAPEETAKVPGQTITVPVTVTYEDNSTDQANAVINVTDPEFIDRTDNPDAPTPEGYHRVTFEAGEGVEDFGKKYYDAKESTKVPADKVPTPVAKQGYANPVWNGDENLKPAEVVVTQDSPKTFVATADEISITTEPKSQNALEKTPITPIKTEQVNVPQGAKLKVTVADQDTYPGLTVDPNTGEVTGTPQITWTGDEEDRQVKVKVELLDDNDQPINDKDGKPVANYATIDVYRDTDGDGLPDKDTGMPVDPNNPGVGPIAGDDDDDNDGIPDDKDENPKVWDALKVTPKDIPAQTDKVKVADNIPAVEVNKPKATITSTETNGLYVDDKGNLAGTPNITDWKTSEKDRVVNIPVEVVSPGTAKDGTDEKENVTVPVKVINPNVVSQADVLDPRYKDAETQPGVEVTTDEPEFFDQGTENKNTKPEGTTFDKGENVPTDKGDITIDKGTGKVTYKPAPGIGEENPEKVQIPVKVTYPDKSSEETTVTITVGKDIYDRGDNDDGSGGDKHPVPEGYYRVTVQPAEHLQFKDKADKKRQVYDVKKVVKDETGQEKPGTVDVSGLVFEAKAEHKNDYKPDLVDGKQVYDPAVTDLTISSEGTYTAKETETDAKKYTPEAKELVKEKGNKPTEEEITGQVTIPDYPEEAGKPTISVKNPDDIPSGEEVVDKKPVPTVIEYPDGSKDELDVPVTIQETAPEHKQTYEPSYAPAETQPETKVTVEKPSFTKDGVDLSEGETVPLADTDPFKVTQPAQGKVENVQPDGSFDFTPNAGIGEENPETVTIDVLVTYGDGSSEKTQVKVTVGKDIYDRGDNDDGSGGDKHPVPEGYYRVTVQPAEHLQFKDKADKKRQVYDVKKVVKDETGQEKPGTVDVSGLVFEAKAEHKNDYKPDLVDGKQVYDPAVTDLTISSEGTYTAKETETDAKKYTPEAKELVKEKGNKPTEEEITGQVTIPDYPEEAGKPTISVKNPDDIPSGEEVVDKKPVPTVIEYPDGSKDELDVPVTIQETAPEHKQTYEPSYAPAETQPETKVTVEKPSFTKDGVDLSEGETVPLADTDPFKVTQPAQGKVENVQPDGSFDFTPNAGIGEENPETVTIDVLVTYGDGSSEKTQVKVTVGKDIYDRGDNDDGSGGDKHPVPEGYYRVTVQPAEHLQFKDKADKKRQVYDVKKVVKDETGQEKPGTVDVSGLVFEAKAEHKNDYKPDLVDGKQVYDPAVTDLTISSEGTYTAKETETDAKKYTPEAKELVKEKGNKPTEEEITGQVTIPDYPEEAGKPTISVKNPDDIPSGEEVVDKKPVPTVIEYPDGSKDELDVPVTIQETTPVSEETEAEQHNPSYPDVEGKPGTTITIPNTGDKLPQGTTIEVTGPEGYVTEVVPGTETEDPKIKVTIPETSKPGEKVELKVEVTYPDGSKDTPTETLDKDGQPIEGAPANPGLTPEITTDKGDSAEGKPGDTVPIKDEKDLPIGPGTKIEEKPGNDTGITIKDTPKGPQVVIPEGKEPGTYLVPVIITHDNGVVEETTIAVEVTPLPGLTDSVGGTNTDTTPDSVVVVATDPIKAKASTDPSVATDPIKAKVSTDPSVATLPATGEVSHLAIFNTAALSVLAGLGMIATSKRKEEEED